MRPIALVITYSEVGDPLFHLNQTVVPSFLLPVLSSGIFFIYKTFKRQKTYQRYRQSPAPDDKEPRSEKATVSLTGPNPSTNIERGDDCFSIIGLFRELCRIASFLLPLAISLVAVGLATSCLGWRWVLYGLPATPPSLSLGPLLVGGQLFFALWTTASFLQPQGLRLRRAERSPVVTLQYEASFDGNIVGWTIVVEVLAWGVLRTWNMTSGAR